MRVNIRIILSSIFELIAAFGFAALESYELHNSSFKMMYYLYMEINRLSSSLYLSLLSIDLYAKPYFVSNI